MGCLAHRRPTRLRWLLVTAALSMVCNCADAEPAPGRTFRVASEVDAERSLSIVLPVGWTVEPGKSDGRHERFVVAPKRRATVFPYVLVTIDHEPDPEDVPSANAPLLRTPTGEPYVAGSEATPFHDVDRDMIWSSKSTEAGYTVVVDLTRGAAAYRFDFRHERIHPTSFDPTVVKIVDGLRFGDAAKETTTGEPSPVANGDGDEDRVFEMRTDADDRADREARSRSLVVAGVGLCVLCVLFLVYQWSVRRSGDARLRETTATMRAARKRGRRGDSGTREESA